VRFYEFVTLHSNTFINIKYFNSFSFGNKYFLLSQFKLSFMSICIYYIIYKNIFSCALKTWIDRDKQTCKPTSASILFLAYTIRTPTHSPAHTMCVSLKQVLKLITAISVENCFMHWQHVGWTMEPCHHMHVCLCGPATRLFY